MSDTEIETLAGKVAALMCADYYGKRGDCESIAAYILENYVEKAAFDRSPHLTKPGEPCPDHPPACQTERDGATVCLWCLDAAMYEELLRGIKHRESALVKQVERLRSALDLLLQDDYTKFMRRADVIEARLAVEEKP